MDFETTRFCATLWIAETSPAKKFPLFYGGWLVSPICQVPVAGGRILEEERYEIPVQG